MELDVSTLLTTTGGLGLLISLLIQATVKPLLAARGVSSETPSYGLILNIVAIALGLGLGALGLFFLDSEIEASTVVTVLITGLFGAFTAVGLYEVSSNLTSHRSQ